MRPIDADAWFERIDADHCASCRRLPCPCSKCGIGIARESIENTPTIDAVRVVRCKDCKYYKAEKLERIKDSVFFTCPITGGMFSPDDYCSDGERRADDDDADLISRKAAVSRISDLIVLELRCERIPTWNEVYKALNDLPTLDAVPVIRCTKCKYYGPGDHAGFWRCENWGVDINSQASPPETFYCADGEQKEEET